MKKSEKLNGRFYIEREDNWLLIDSTDGTLVGFDTKADALWARKFSRKYVRLHGDIDLLTFPYTLDEPLSYDKYEGREREYKEDLTGEKSTRKNP